MLVLGIFLIYLVSYTNADEANGTTTNTTTYDYYTGEPLTAELLSYYNEVNQTGTCTIDIVVPCDPTERRRMDGSCNNLNQPARGTFFSPMDRLLPASFDNVYYERKAVSGNNLPPARKIRLELLHASSPTCHKDLNQNIPGYASTMYLDTGSVHDTQDFLLETTYCCEPEHINTYECTSHIIPGDDPVFKFSNISCLNQTRSLYYQTYNCTKDPVLSPIAKATSAFDMSHVYNAYNDGGYIARKNESGLMIVEEEDGKLWPPSGPRGVCPINNAAKNETRCFNNHLNGLISANMFTVWFVRQHNLIAGELAELNPCWDDETLYQTARDINTAYAMQMYIYEWLDALVGHENLVNAGIAYTDPGFRDLYDNCSYPVVLLEYAYGMRWFHLMLQDNAELYDSVGEHIEDYDSFLTSFATGLLARNDYISLFTQWSYRQCANAIDLGVAYHNANDAFPGLQRAVDIGTGDLRRGRTFGLPPYVDYVYNFTGENITTWDQLKTRIDKTRVIKLMKVYEDPRDIDLIAGLWTEKLIDGGRVSEILGHILIENIKKTIKGDRHWYERPNRPYAFTAEQLLEVRKSSLALMLCNVGDKVIQVPRKAFLNISPQNPIVNCSEIPKMNFTVWKDESCENDIEVSK